MDAYTLAEDIENGLFNDSNYNKKKAADFIRQQDDQIKELEKDLHMLQRHYGQLDHDLKEK